MASDTSSSTDSLKSIHLTTMPVYNEATPNLYTDLKKKEKEYAIARKLRWITRGFCLFYTIIVILIGSQMEPDFGTASVVFVASPLMAACVGVWIEMYAGRVEFDYWLMLQLNLSVRTGAARQLGRDGEASSIRSQSGEAKQNISAENALAGHKDD